MSQSDFHSEDEIFAFPVSELARIGELVATYGGYLPEAPLKKAGKPVLCIAGCRDQTDGPLVLRALKYPVSANTMPLSDGRHAFVGYWSESIREAVNNGEVTAELLTEDQLNALRPEFTV